MLSTSICLVALSLAHPALIPVPTSTSWGIGEFHLTSETIISGEGPANSIAKQFHYLVGTGKVSTQHALSRGVKFVLDPKMNGQSDESYRLRVDAGQILASALKPQGLFYAMQTLRQLLPPEIEGVHKAKKDWRIPSVAIEDSPRFGWRGMHLDVSRHFFDANEIKKYIDYLAAYKMNIFHWHLIDDGGWRIQIDKYPQLTKVGAWRTPGEPWSQRNLRFPGGDPKSMYGGFYTKAQVHEIVKYAAARFITVVPEIEMPGHTLPAIVAYPELACEGYDAEEFAKQSGAYRANVYCAGNDLSFEFIDNVLTEVCEMFPGKFVHIGGDEVNKYLWSNCPKCALRMKNEKLRDVDELQSYFIKRVEKLLSAKGKRLIGWDEILEGGLAPGAAVMSWRGESGGIAAANMNHDVVMSPTSPCYFDFSYNDNSSRNVYEYNPIPSELKGNSRLRVLGAQANVWTEWIPNFKKVEQMIFPRMLAMADVVWRNSTSNEWGQFEPLLAAHFARLDAMGAAFTMPQPSINETLIFLDGPQKVSLNAVPYPSFTLRYTKNGTVPNGQSQKYSGPIQVDEPCVIRAAYVASSGAVGDPVSIAIVKPGSAPAVTMQPGLVREFYQGTWSKVPDFSTITAKTKELVASFDSKSFEGGENYALRFTGFIKIPTTGSYTFYLGSDDGSIMNLAGVRFIDNDGLHGFGIKESKVKLRAGVYAVEVGFFEQGGADKLTVEVEGPGFSRSTIPSSWLFTKGAK